ncbi:hypothetical protein [Caballeronia sp. LZ032]|uniref:hypothetical protein n=1 Tax=Caballeronia sp. LZ032 TaxID=3038565 RepID=UPI00285C601D|nr:hypothetical protein [Caballeronia sp. LZ032]MDR5878782.1 hypothetical protein [Caballeronia sp. LZ032]
MPIKTRKPGIQVVLHKNISRKTTSGKTPVSARYAGQSSVVDLTPYLSENNPVRVSKSVREPSGTFTLALADKIDTDILDSLYSVIEPMDSIVIRISAWSATPDGTNMPIMMRGFVSQVQRMEGMSADGKPTRTVVVSGHDYGKILQMMQIFFMPNAPEDAAAMITSFPFFAKFGDFDNVMETGKFTQAVFDKVVNPYLANMSKNAASTDAVMQIATDIQVTESKVSLFGVGTFNGANVHALIHSHGDIGPWNEFFVEDRESGPVAVYRPNPFKDPASGDFLMSGVTAPMVVGIDRSAIVSMTVARTDAHVANYFWADCPRFLTNYGSTARMLAYSSPQDSASFYVTDYGNVDPALYGVRKMEETTNQAGLDEPNNGNGTQNGPSRNAAQNGALSWIYNRRQQLYDLNKDNVVLETGSMRLSGRESIKAGRYLRLTHGTMQSEYYIVGVVHDFTPFGSYFTEVQFERGTGFVDRINKWSTQQAPYHSEMVTKQ